MEGESNAESEVPVWARPDAFPVKPSGQGEFGLIDSRGNLHAAANARDLAQKVSHARNAVDLVWHPGSTRLLVPEELSLLHESLRTRQRRLAEQNLSNGRRMGLVFGLIMLWTVYAAWKNSGGRIEAVFSHQLTGLAAMLLFVFGILPFYEGWKASRRIGSTKASDLAGEIPEARFDAWLHRQRIPATWLLMGALLVCGLVQVCFDWGRTQFEASVVQAGLLKQAALHYPGQADGGAWWRIMTAPLLHGNAIHFLLNAGGVLYLGRRTEIIARWPHMLIVFVAAAWVGGLASFYWIPDKIYVGASGGLMGLLGFMLVFEHLHSRLVPRPATKRLIAGLMVMMVIGLLGISFIDNAAHAGGLLAGMAYAWIVFPKTASTRRPESMKRDIVVGAAAAGLILLAACTTCFKILT